MASRFNLTPRAKDDLRGIWSYTFDIWSEAQADSYVTQLYERFSWLAMQPRLGRHRYDIAKGYYCFPQSAHLVFYLIRSDGIVIIGVPHKDMDIFNYFDS